MAGQCTDAERRLAEMCVGLATGVQDGTGGSGGLGDRLTSQCAGHLAVDAALLMVRRHRPGATAVVSASTARARSVALVGIEFGQGPVAGCLRTGEPVGVPDLGDRAAHWPRYVDAATRHGLRAVHALGLRASRSTPPGRLGGATTTIGVLVLFGDAVGAITAADASVAQALADLAAPALAADPTPHCRTATAAAAALADLTVLERAQWVLADRHRLTMAQARARLADHALGRDLHVTEVARAVLEGSLDVSDWYRAPMRPVRRRPA